MASIFNYLRPKVVEPDVGKTTQRALPASWYTSPEMFELERRAIFSKKWMLTTHSSRLKDPGSWLRYEVAGFGFIVCKDRTGYINAFHNICRHRAFPVVTATQGQSKILACKYHGWSYGLDGKLAKAPGYQELEFDRSKNGLFPIHVHVDAKGFVWVNMDAQKTPEPWSEDFAGVDMQARFEGIDFFDYDFDHSWEMEGDYNWKILADNYNECYHCLTAHPDVPSLADLNAYSVDTVGGHIQHFANPQADKLDPQLKIASTFYFPNASMTVAPSFAFTQRFEPISATKTVMRYEVFRRKGVDAADFENINAMFKRIMSEDKDLCNKAQENLNNGVFVNGELHPRMEKGPLFFQQTVRGIVMAHRSREEAVKQEIWPARQILPDSASKSQGDIEFCSSLACGIGEEKVSW